MAINGGRINFQVGYNVDTSGLQKGNQAVRESLSTLKAEAKKSSNLLKDNMQKAFQSAEKLETAYNKAFNSNLGSLNVATLNKELKNSGTSLKELQKDFLNAGSTGQVAWARLGSQILGTNVQIRQTNTLLDQMATTMANTVKWGITSRIFNEITTSVSDAFHYVKQLDSSLNDIRIVTDKSADSMKDFAKQANEAAKALGASTRDYTEASLIYFQQGLGDTEAAARAETTLKAANVTGQSADEVSEQLTAVWNGYKVSADEAELYVDKLSAVAATTAADLEELSTGMSKVASAANLMGVDIDQLNAQLATIVSVTRQAPESVGTALKTIYARMGDIEAGLDTEVTLGEYTSQMAAMGVNVLDANDKLRDMGDVIEEIGGKWTTLSREQQVALSQIMAGTRQYNNLLSLFDNWGMYTDAIETSTNAMGTLNKQNEIYLESTEAKLQQLKTTMEGVYGELLDTDTINTFVEAMTNLASVTEKFIGSFGGGLKSISFISIMIANIFNKQLSRGITNLIQKQQAYNQNVQELQQKINFINLGMTQGYEKNNILGQAALHGYESQLKIAEKIVAVRAGLTNEEYNHLTTLQQEVGALEEQSKIIELQTQKRAKKILSEDPSAAETLTNLAFTGSDEEIEAEQNNIEERIKNSQEELEQAEDTLAIYGDINKSEAERYQIAKDILNNAKNEKKVGKEAEKQADKIVKSISDENKIAYDNYNIAKEEVRKKQEALELEQRKRDVFNQAVEAAVRKNELDKKSLDIQRSIIDFTKIAEGGKRVQQIFTGITSSISSVAMAWSGFSGIINTVFDDTLSDGEKFSQLFISLGFTLPMITSAMNKFNALLGIQGGLFEGLALKKELNNIADTISLKIGGRTYTQILREVQARNLNIAAMSNEEIHETALLIAGENTSARKIKNIELTILHRREEEKLNKTLYKNPYLLIGMVIVGIIAAIVSWQKKKHEQEVEEHKEKLEKLNTLEEENKKLIELTSSYEELYNVYKKTGKGQDELKTKQQEIIKGLGEEGKALKGLTNNYDLFNKKLKEIQIDEIKNQIENTQDTLSSAEFLLDDKLDETEFIETFTRESLENSDKQDKTALEIGIKRNLFDFYDEEHATGSNIYVFKDQNNLTDPEALIQQYDNVEQALKDMREEGLQETRFYEQLNDWYNTLSESVEKYRKNLNLLSSQYAQLSIIESAQVGVNTQEEYEKYKENIINEFKNNEEIMKAAEASGDSETYLEDLFDTTVAQYGNEDIQKQNQLEEERQALITSLTESNIIKNAFIAKEKDIKDIKDITPEKTLEEYMQIVSQYIQDNGLASIFSAEALTQEDWTNFLNAKGSEQALEELIEKSRNKLREGFEANQAGILGDLSASLMTEAQSGDLTIENIADNENWTALEKQLETIKTLYPELRGEVETLNNTAIVGSQSWISALGAVQDAMSQLSLSSTAKEIEEEIKDIDITLDTKNFEKELNEVLDLKRELVIEVRAETTQEFNEMVNGMNSLTETASKIGDDFKVSAEDIYALGQAFPEIYENAEYLADGTIKLNSEVVKSSMAAAQAEITDDYRKTIAKLKNKKADVDANIKLYENLVQIATDAAADEKKIEKAKADIKAGLDNEIQLSDINTTNVELENIDAVAKSEASMYETSVKNANEAAREKVKISKIEAEAKRHNALYGEGQESSTVEYTYEVKYKGEVADISDATTVNETKIDDIETTDEMKDMASGLNQYLASLREYSDELGIEITAANSEYLQSMFQLKGAGSGLGIDNKKDGSNKDKEILDKIKDERDVYLEINQQLEAMEAHMSSLETANEKLFGQSKIDNYKKQIENLDKQIELSKEKIKISATETARYRKALEKDGLTFDKDGMLTNYDEWYKAEKKEINKLISEYNKLSATEQESKKGKKLKDKIEDKKANFEESQGWVDSYLDSTQQEMEDINAVAEAEAEKVSKYIESLDYEIQLKVDDSELQNAYEDFQQNLMSEDNFKGKASSLARQYQNIISSGQLEARNAQIEEVKKAIQTIEKGGTDENFGTDLEQAREHLKTLIEEQISDYEQLQELSVSLAENWGDSLDQMSEDMEDIQTEFDNLSSKAEHYANLTKLLFGDEDYIKQKQFFQNQDDINRARLNTLQQDLKVWEEQRKKTEVLYDQAIKNGNMAMADTYKETMDSLDDTIQETTESIQSTLEETLENIADEFENAIKSATQKAEETLSGGLGFDVISDGLSKAKQYSDDWLDDVQEIYEINKLTREFDNAAAAASTASAQQKILAAKQKELAILEKQDKLSQYDLDRANAQFNLTLKQIALEEAQQNKSKMVLKRDTQGNYSYQYSADQEQISKAQQDVADAELKVNELDQDRYFQLAQGLAELNRSMLEDMEKANIEYANDEEKLAQARLQIEDYYNKEKANLKEDLGIVEEHLMDSSFAYFKSLYDIDALNWKNMTDTEKETYRTFIFGEEGLVPIATSGFDKIKATLTGEEDSFDVVFVETMNTCQTALDTYKTKVNEVATAVGGDFYKIVHGEGDNSGGLIDTKTATEELAKENEELITSYTGENGILPAIEAICKEFGNQEAKHLAVKKAMDKQIKSGTQLLTDMQGIGDQVDTLKEKMKDLKDAIDKIPKHKKVTIEYETTGDNPDNYGKGGETPPLTYSKKGTLYRSLESEQITFYDAPGTRNNPKVEIFKIPASYDFKAIDSYNNWLYLQGVGITPEGKIPEGWIFNQNVRAFDTGGYTGSWNSSNGKMAMLHEKELVLNKEDTRNILSAVNSVRMIDSIISSLEHSMKSRMFGLMMDSYSQAKGYTREDKGFEQHVQINASFPDAVDHNEIEIALNNLMNRASQLAWSDNR